MSLDERPAASEAHATQLGRAIGALKAFQQDLEGARYRIVGSAIHLLYDHAERIDPEVSVDDIPSADIPELRTLSTFCRGVARHFEARDDQQIVMSTAGFADDRLAALAGACTGGDAADSCPHCGDGHLYTVGVGELRCDSCGAEVTRDA